MKEAMTSVIGPGSVRGPGHRGQARDALPWGQCMARKFSLRPSIGWSADGLRGEVGLLGDKTMRSRRSAIGLQLGVLLITCIGGCASQRAVVSQHHSPPASTTVPQTTAVHAVVQSGPGQSGSTYRWAMQPAASAEGVALVPVETPALNAVPADQHIEVPTLMPISEVSDRPVELIAVVHEPELTPATADADDDIPRLEILPLDVLEADEKAKPSRPVYHQPSVERTVREADAVLIPPVSDLPLKPIEETRLDSSETEHCPEAILRDPSLHVEPLLVTLSRDPDARQRALAATLLAEAPETDARVNTVLKRHISESEGIVAAAAVDSLLMRGVVNRESVQALLVLSTHERVSVRRQVACSARRLANSSWADETVSALLPLLDDADDGVRSMAALTLSDFSVQSDAILDRLLERYTVETDEGVARSVELAVERVGTLPQDDRDVVVAGSSL